MLRRLAQVMVLLIDRCYITIQIIIPVSQPLLWVLRSAWAVLPQCYSLGIGTPTASLCPGLEDTCWVSSGGKLRQSWMNMDLASERLNGRGPSRRRKAPTALESFKCIFIPILAAVLSLICLVTVGFLVKVYLDNHYFFCKQPLKLVPLQRVCDGQVDCLEGEDEANCPQWVPEGPPAGARVSKDRSILQVFNKNTGAWSCICHDHFNLVLAKAACERMGYR
ncbi:PREDICTED: transmembrane protease serine 4, partial [Eurypyga helias]|uniref:transmembrane protease serine 4 n=1 Tax=Eurypyga helias TaxID=54383 RepID=UPI00052954F1